MAIDLTTTMTPDSRLKSSWIQSSHRLDSEFEISGDKTKPGRFHFRFVHLCVNGKTNPVLKRSGFVTNPEQFPSKPSLSGKTRALKRWSILVVK